MHANRPSPALGSHGLHALTIWACSPCHDLDRLLELNRGRHSSIFARIEGRRISMNPFRRPGRSERGANRPEGQIVPAGSQSPVSGHPGAFGAGSGQSPQVAADKSPGIAVPPVGVSAATLIAGQPRLGKKVEINFVTRYAMTDIVEIERRAVAKPLPRAALDQLLNRRNVMGIVAKYDSIIGYAIYEMHQFHLDVLMLVVDPRDRRSGVGSRLLSELK